MTLMTTRMTPLNRPVPAVPGPFDGLRRVAAFLGWVLSGFGLLTYLFRRKAGGRSRSGEVVVYSVHRSFYLWAIILAGFAGAALARRYPDSATLFGWVYLAVLMYTLVTLLFDVGTWKLMLWTGVFAFLWLICRYLEDLRHVTVLSSLAGYLGGLRPHLDPGFATALSWLLLLPWVGALFHSFGQGRTAFSPNSIEEWFMGEGREITDRAGLKFRSRYRDLLETALGLGAGDLEAVDGNGQVVKRWENVVFLAFIWRRLDAILHTRSAVVDNAPGDVLEVGVERVRR